MLLVECEEREFKDMSMEDLRNLNQVVITKWNPGHDGGWLSSLLGRASS